LFFKKILEFNGFSSVHFRFLGVLSDDGVIVLDLRLEVVSSGGKGISLGGEVSKFLGPLGGLSLFPSGIGDSGGSDLSFKGGKKAGDLSEELWVSWGRSDLSEGVDQWGVGGEFVVKVGHVFKSFGNTLNSSLKLDEKSTSAERSKKVNGILTSSNTGIVFSIKSTPCGVFHISLSLSSFDSTVNAVKFSKGGSEHAFSISKKSFSVFNGLVTGVSSGGVSVSVVGIFGEESVACGSAFGVDRVGFSLLGVEFSNEAVDESDNGVKVSLSSGHVNGNLGE
jgi:hypothetical protein